ncbi:MAG TPA: hypothetical protein VGG05_28245 [Pseudonocardiaceae bacterium]|jgi:hypothetical protein
MTRLTLIVEADGTDAHRLDHLTSTLRSDLVATGLVTVARPRTDPPPDARTGAGLSVGELIVSGVLSTGTMSALASVLIAHIRRTGARSVTVRRGEDEYRFTGLSEDAQRDLIHQLTAGADESAR